MKLVTGGLRFFQLIFCAVVLGLSISLAKGQGPKSEGFSAVPATTGYSAFAGAFGLIAGIVGVAALFVDSLNGIITWALDAVAAVFLLAGGIAMAVGLRGVNCTKTKDNSATGYNPILNCGSTKKGKDTFFGCDANQILSRCKMARADDVFMFLAFLVGLGALASSFLGHKGRSGRSGYV